MTLALLLPLTLGACSLLGPGEGAPADAAENNACGPFAGIETGRAWTWAPTSKVARGPMTQTVTEFDGFRGVLKSVGAAESVLATLQFHCDGGLVVDSVDHTYSGNGITTYEDPQPSIPASITVGQRWEVEHKGTVTSDVGTTPFHYTSTFEILAEESHSVHAGTWNAFHIRETRDSREDAYRWVGAGVGVIEYDGVELAGWSG